MLKYEYFIIGFLLLFSISCSDEVTPNNDVMDTSATMATEMMAGTTAGTTINNPTAGTVMAGTTGELAGNVAGTMAEELAGTMAGTMAGTSAGTSAGTTAGTSAGTTAGTSAGTTAGTSAGTTAGTSAGTTAGTSAGTQNETKDCQGDVTWVPPEQSGIVYISHFESNSLIWYRLDVQAPTEVGRLEMNAPAHDSDLDETNNLLAIAHDINRSISLYGLSRPTMVGGAFNAPRLLQTIDTSPYTPRRVLFDSSRRQLHVVSNLPLDGELLTEMHILTYDISQPGVAVGEPNSTFTIPVTTSITIDPRTGILFLVNLETDHLHAYHSSSIGSLFEVSGNPIDLRALLPETNNTAFDARNIQIDPIRGRILLARSQGAMSETIVFAYPSLREEQAECDALLTYQSITHIPDQFDVSIEPQDRVNLLGAYTLIPVIGENLMAFIHDAWNGFQSTSMITLMSEIEGVIQTQVGCGDFEGFGCFLRSYINENPISYELTDGATCVDRSRLIFTATSYDITDIEGAGQVYFYHYDRATSEMSRLLSPEGRTHVTAAYPVNANCH